MKALILAAGRGSRMGSLTETQPKCFATLKGRRLIDWQLHSLREAGITEIGIVTGYAEEKLSSLGLKTFHNERWASTNMVQSLRQASEWLKTDEIVVSYSDIVYHSDLVQSLLESKHPLSMTFDLDWHSLWQLRFADPLVDAETFKFDTDFRVRKIGGRPAAVSDVAGQFMGLIKFTPESWTAFETVVSMCEQSEADKLDTTKALSLLIESDYPVYGVPISGRWCEVDSEIDKNLYEGKLAGEWSHNWIVGKRDKNEN